MILSFEPHCTQMKQSGSNQLYIIPHHILSGVGFATRQIGKRVSSTEDIGDHGEEWSLKITSTFKNIALRFKLGDEFEETTMDGRKVMVRIHIHPSIPLPSSSSES